MANHSGAISHAWNHSDCCCGSPHDCAPHPRAARHISRARGLLGASPAGFWASRLAASALWSRSLAPRGTGVASSGASDPFGGACGFVCNSVSFHRLQAVFGGLESPRGGLQDVQKAQNLHKGAQTIHFHTEVVKYDNYFYNFALGSHYSKADGCATSGSPGAPGDCSVILSRTKTPIDAASWEHVPGGTYPWHRNSCCWMAAITHAHPHRPSPHSNEYGDSSHRLLAFSASG